MTDPQTNGAAGAPAAMIAGCTRAQRRLLERLETIDDLVVTRPSRLPGWTIGHLLTHLARNADAFVNMLEEAELGHSVPMYPGGPAQRSDDIEAGSTRSAAACVADVRRSARRLEVLFGDASEALWEGAGVGLDGQPWSCRNVPFRRWREVEFHHVDLGLGYEPEDWPADFVSLALADSRDHVPGRVADARQRSALLAWVSGRRDTPGPIDFAPF